MFKKAVLPHPQIYLTHFIKNSNASSWIYIHGGPGYNCGIVEYLIEHNNLFGLFNDNIVLYDQRTCGRSIDFSEEVTHADNIHDLDEIYHYLTKLCGIPIKGFIGHSYGAKLLFDYYKKYNCTVPGIFISTANSILTPRLNNLFFDLLYLKKTNPIKYNDILIEMPNLDLGRLWSLTEELAPFFQENKERHYLYWANLDCMEKVQNIQRIINLPVNQKTFMNVRKNLYSSEKKLSIAIDKLTIPYLWINGFHDVVMNGSEGTFLNPLSPIISFYQSAHYPHIEENNRFCQLVNHTFK